MLSGRMRLLKSKTVDLRRLAKEKVTYEKEALQQRVKVDSYKEQSKGRTLPNKSRRSPLGVTYDS